MFESIVAFMLQYKYILLFYLSVIIFLLLKRKKLDIQAKVIILYRMKLGIRWMDRCVAQFREWIVLLGYIGVGAGYVGLIFISYILIKNLYDLATTPAAPSGVSLVLPGVNVPGLGVLPFWYWILAIFTIAIVHEFSHGIVARAHNIEVKNTGLVFLGPILGAFVEPNEKKLQKENDIVQYSVLAAGSFSNILLGIMSILLLMVVFTPIQNALVQPTGFTFDSYYEGAYPIQQAGIAPGTLITGVNGQGVSSFQEFSETLNGIKPAEKITLMTPKQEYPITLAVSPDDAKKGFLGIKEIHNEFELKSQYQSWNPFYLVLTWIQGFLRWLFLLSIGIGLFNLLPLPIVDGGRMAQVFLHKLKGLISLNLNNGSISI